MTLQQTDCMNHNALHNILLKNHCSSAPRHHTLYTELNKRAKELLVEEVTVHSYQRDTMLPFNPLESWESSQDRNTTFKQITCNSRSNTPTFGPALCWNHFLKICLLSTLSDWDLLSLMIWRQTFVFFHRSYNQCFSVHSVAVYKFLKRQVN